MGSPTATSATPTGRARLGRAFPAIPRARTALRIDAYLDRIRYEGPTTPTLATLRSLHRAHMTSVPFENLDIQLGVPIILSTPSFFEKIVTRRRGGFCYELNGLFAWLLGELGFRVALHSARVTSQGALSPEFDHLLVSVELDGRWIADVGFGDSSLDPQRGSSTDRDEAGEYSLVEDSGTWTMRRRRDGIVQPQYVFTFLPRRLEEFEDRCLFQQTSPESHFTQRTICSRATPEGRISLAGRKLIVTAEGRRGEREIADRKEYRSTLMSEFGIELTRREIDAVARVLTLA